MYIKYYLPACKNDIKGLIYHKTKDKKQPLYITEDREDAIRQLFSMCDSGGYIYVLKKMDIKGNLNGGYKSEPPYEIIGCERIENETDL